MSIPINVLYYNDLLHEWILKGTSDYQQTKDEYLYFRVLSGGKKYFYASPEDYFEHNKNYIEPMHVNSDNSVEYTNIKGEIVFIE
uniref:Uncharacterized protein n=1 Tax=viral metagenome TaxID=1070528 RepID=A0A6C0LGU0_9ZZZZ